MICEWNISWICSQVQKSQPIWHSVKSVQILNLRIQSEYRNIRTRKNSVLGHFSRSIRCIERLQSDLHWEWYLRHLSEKSLKWWSFCDVFKTPQIHLKKDVFYVMSLTHLKHISKKMSILWLLLGTSQIFIANTCGILKILHENGFMWAAH